MFRYNRRQHPRGDVQRQYERITTVPMKDIVLVPATEEKNKRLYVWRITDFLVQRVQDTSTSVISLLKIELQKERLILSIVLQSSELLITESLRRRTYLTNEAKQIIQPLGRILLKTPQSSSRQFLYPAWRLKQKE